MIQNIKPEDLRTMRGKEGLILQGCGGDPQEWLDGINEMLTKEKILLDDTKFSDISVFEKEGVTNILFPFDNAVHTDTGKLAVWRLATHNTFYGTWLTDYVENNLGGFENKDEKIKPDCELIGQDGNIFNLMGIASQTLKRSGLKSEASEMCNRIMSSGSYDEALCIIGEYVNITGPADEFENEYDDEEEGMEMSL
jgi:hypothetical protein